MSRSGRCLSLWQPWASLVRPEAGFKHIETRGWGTGYRGLLAIHAAQKFDQERAAAVLECGIAGRSAGTEGIDGVSVRIIPVSPLPGEIIARPMRTRREIAGLFDAPPLRQERWCGRGAVPT